MPRHGHVTIMLTLFARTLRLGQPIALDWNEGSTGLLPRAPDARRRIRFDERMAALAEVTQEATSEEPEPPSAPNGPEEDDLMARLAEGDINSVFFKARSLVANGQAWAESYLAKAKEAME